VFGGRRGAGGVQASVERRRRKRELLRPVRDVARLRKCKLPPRARAARDLLYCPYTVYPRAVWGPS
jgi:hypothetical protein